MTKREVIEDPASCLNKAADDEPVFVLRAKDPVASKAVREWAALARFESRHKDSKRDEALTVADQMDRWRRK